LKRLSMTAARRCETAKTGRCRCRCGGRLHGAARGEGQEFFEGLPLEDPHHARAKPVRKKRILKRDKVPPLFEGMYSDV
jgi:hypothetical protein